MCARVCEHMSACVRRLFVCVVNVLVSVVVSRERVCEYE